MNLRGATTYLSPSQSLHFNYPLQLLIFIFRKAMEQKTSATVVATGSCAATWHCKRTQAWLKSRFGRCALNNRKKKPHTQATYDQVIFPKPDKALWLHVPLWTSGDVQIWIII